MKFNKEEVVNQIKAASAMFVAEHESIALLPDDQYEEEIVKLCSKYTQYLDLLEESRREYPGINEEFVGNQQFEAFTLAMETCRLKNVLSFLTGMYDSLEGKKEEDVADLIEPILADIDVANRRYFLEFFFSEKSSVEAKHTQIVLNHEIIQNNVYLLGVLDMATDVYLNGGQILILKDLHNNIFEVSSVNSEDSEFLGNDEAQTALLDQYSCHYKLAEHVYTDF